MRREVTSDRRNAHQPPVWVKARERKARIVLYSSLAFLAFLLVASVVGQGGIYGVHQMGKKNRALQSDIARVEAENRSLRVFIESLRNDPHSVEKIAREELGLVKPGETVYVLIPPAPQSVPGAANRR